MTFKEKILLLKRPNKLFHVLLWWICFRTPFFNWMSDEINLKMKYKLMTGKSLNIDNPVSFTEKLQWLKIHDRKSIYTTMVDKFAVKKYVSEKIGQQYVVPILGIWDSFDDIDFTILPNKFVLKCTHDSGGIVICKDLRKFNKKEAKRKINKCLKRQFFWIAREWPYKDVKPRIIAEQYIENETDKSGVLRDYKFYCFNGQAEFLYISENLTNHKDAKISFLSLDWNYLPFYRKDYNQYEELPPKPQHLDLMIKFANQFSEKIPFLRVDFYEVNNKVYFGELTFSPGGGFTEFFPYEWEIFWGNKIII